MKDTTRKEIEIIGRFLGSAAYGFVYAPKIVIGEIRRENKKKRALKKTNRLHKEYGKKLHDGTLTKEESDRLVNEFIEAVNEFRNLYGMR